MLLAAGTRRAKDDVGCVGGTHASNGKLHRAGRARSEYEDGVVQTQLGQNAVGAPTRLILLGVDLRRQACTGAESRRRWSVGTMAQV